VSRAALLEASMHRAIELARRGAGRVEPNPMVGALVIAPDHGNAAGGGTAGGNAAGTGRIVGAGWHAVHGGPHAEVMALAEAGVAARGATLVVTLEPCCHHGKTPPCTEQIIAAGVTRVVVGCRDPFPAVAGAGIEALRRAGIAVDVGVCAAEAGRLVAPFRTLVERGRPWVVAKWAMSLDGRVATAARESQWISSPESREAVHALRGQMDGILVGIGTALADDPLLTARPPGPRVAIRIVLDGAARLPPGSRLVRTAREVPVLVAVGPDAPADRVDPLAAAGCEIWRSRAADRAGRLGELLTELGRRRLTNLIVEGGPGVLGGFADAGMIDEVWTFMAPRIIGGAEAPAAVDGVGIAALAAAVAIDVEEVSRPGGDILIRGTVRR